MKGNARTDVAGSDRNRGAQEQFGDYMRRALGGFFVDVEPAPVPPPELVATTALLHAENRETESQPAVYRGTGLIVNLRFMSALAQTGCNLRTIGALYEIGCGTGKIISHLRCMRGIRLVASDVNGDAIDWCRDNLPGVEFHVNSLEPPLVFAQEGEFDCVIAQSVFTHIPLNLQRPWLDEISRILAPGGWFACTVLGDFFAGEVLSAADREMLAREGSLTLDADDERASYSTQVMGSWDVFQTREQVLKSFGAVFEVKDYRPGKLDLLALRKRDG